MPIYRENKTNYPPTQPGRDGRYTYFFLNGKIHATIRRNKPANTLEAWCFPDEKMYTYIFTDVVNHMERAFDLSQVVKILHRNKEAILSAWREEKLELCGQKIHWRPGKGKWKFSEEDVMKMLSYFAGTRGNITAKGPVKKNGRLTNLPSPAEARAMMNYNELTYIKNSKGEFVPVYGDLKR